MKVEKTPLAVGVPANVEDALRLDAHALERRLVGDRGDDEVAGVIEADESRSNRWSMLGVKRSPFSPSRRSSFDESRQGLQWLATR